MPAQRLVLIDGYSNIFRAFYALRNLSNSKGEPTNAVYGFINMLKKLLREENPELVGIALDMSEKTFRSERFAEYKANRTPMPEDLKSQLPWIRRAIEAYRIPILEAQKYEADDVLGSLAAQAAAAGYEVVLVSADKDLMQLVRPGISLFHTGRNKLYDEAGVTEDFGVPPSRVADVLALMGDSVDNVPGVPGIGEKGAKQLIKEFGSLEALLERAGEITRKGYREGLQQHREQALLSKELVTIPTDLPVTFDPQALRHDPPDNEALRALFSELEFFSLVEELAPAKEPSALVAPAEAHEVQSPAEWLSAIAELGATEPIHVARLGESRPIALAVALGERVVVADLRREGLDAAVRGTLGGWFADPAREVVGHDVKQLLKMVDRAAAIDAAPRPRAAIFDTMLVSYLLRPAVRGHGLGEVALERLGVQVITDVEAGWGKDQEPPPGDARLLACAAERVTLVRRFAEAMRGELGGDLSAAPPGAGGGDLNAASRAGGADLNAASRTGGADLNAASRTGGLLRVYREIEEPLLPVLLAMEQAGVRLDVEFLRAMSVELGGQVAALEQEIYTLAGETFNINSPTQLGAILFEKLSLPVLGRTKKTKSYTTGAEILEELATRGYPLPERILRYRELTKLKSTYVDALPLLVAADGRVHTTYEQAVAATGRLSSVNPNLQNIPVRGELGQRIRRAFVAEPGCVLLAADYSQIELRVLAHIAGETTFIEAFRRGEDIHASTAAMVFGGTPELVTPDQRRAAKVINFGILYGMSAFGLGKNLGIPSGEADRFIKAYLERLPNVKRYMDETLASAQQTGKVETLYGRARYLPDITSKNFNLRENARRMAINARIQGTAADIQKKAMIAVDAALRAEHPAARLLLSVHDELVIEAPEAQAESVAALVKREMEGVETLKAPLLVETGWGANWLEAKQ